MTNCNRMWISVAFILSVIERLSSLISDMKSLSERGMEVGRGA
jgi:hypothetical protein